MEELRADEGATSAGGWSGIGIITISRHGVMFFDDRTTAFTNVCAQMRSGRRLAHVLGRTDAQRALEGALRRARVAPRVGAWLVLAVAG